MKKDSIAIFAESIYKTTRKRSANVLHGLKEPRPVLVTALYAWIRTCSGSSSVLGSTSLSLTVPTVDLNQGKEEAKPDASCTFSSSRKSCAACGHDK